MDPLRSLQHMLVATVAVSMLADCSGAMAPLQQTSGPSNSAQLRARGVAGMSQGAARSARFDHSRSWMAPDARRTVSLLYVADEAAGDVYVYSYPRGKLKGTLTGFNLPSGMCSNKRGDVFIMNGGGTTVEVFAHGGSAPIRTLNLPGYPELNCSVDPTTGNLALGTLGGSCGDCIAVFTNGSGMPTTYTPSGQNGIPGCGYDSHGNLFCDAYGSGNQFALYKLPAGSSSYYEHRRERCRRPQGRPNAMGREVFSIRLRRAGNHLSDTAFRVDGNHRRFDWASRYWLGLAVLDQADKDHRTHLRGQRRSHRRLLELSGRRQRDENDHRFLAARRRNAQHDQEVDTGHWAARESRNARSRLFRARAAARSNSARASVARPSLKSRSARTLGSRW